MMKFNVEFEQQYTYSHVMSEELQTIAVHSDVRDWYGAGKGGGAS